MALSVCCCAISLALLPVTQPPNPKPMIASATAPPTAPQSMDSILGVNFIEKLMNDPFARWTRGESTGTRRASGRLAICKLERPGRDGRVGVHKNYGITY